MVGDRDDVTAIHGTLAYNRAHLQNLGDSVSSGARRELEFCGRSKSFLRAGVRLRLIQK